MRQSTDTLDSSLVAIIPAAGIGSRMKSELPKQYLTLGQHTILEHTLLALLREPRIERLVVALHPQDRWFKHLSIATHPKIKTVIGGDSRAESVLAGLNAVTADWVLVHDAARPCLHQDDLSALLALMDKGLQGGLLATPVRDTMKRSMIGEHQVAETVDRENLWHALTPQLFPHTALLQALTTALNHDVVITDEASAMEYAGTTPQLVMGRSDNIKVTRPEDLALAGFYLSHIASSMNDDKRPLPSTNEVL